MSEKKEEDIKNYVWAAKNGEVDDMKEIAKNSKQGKELVNMFYEGRLPIHYAADYGQEAVLEYLLENGAKEKINVKDENDILPLEAAFFEEHPECVKILLANGADKGMARQEIQEGLK